MPTYEYECEKCGYTFEKSQSMHDDPFKICPKCNGNVRRLIGKGVGLIFKGSGFYATDYKNSTSSGKTCCGRDTPCETPPCSDDGVCKK